MAISLGPHLDAETTEKYSLEQLSAGKTAEIEKHLLICEPCQAAVAAFDAYVAAMREAAAEVRKTERNAMPHRRVAAR
jgi:anti-sigma factor RsiW